MPDTTVTLKSPQLTVTFSELGAEMQRMVTADGRDLMWDGDPAFWTGRAPILFPIVGRAPDDRIAVNGAEAAMGQHGFARHSHFTVEATGDAWCRMVLEDSDETRRIYPCAFRLALSYRLDGPRLSVTAEVTNRGETVMPFGIGFHPAFRWPLPGAEGQVHSVTLDNGGEPALARLTGDALLGAERLPSPFRAGRMVVEERLFTSGALIFPGGTGLALTYAAEGGDAPALHFEFDNTPNLGIWKKPGAPFLCIEPWHGITAEAGAGPEIADRPFSRLLPPGEMASFGYAVTVLQG